MDVTIEQDNYHSVTISGGFTGPYINFTISPAQAYELLRKLEARRVELYDLVTNYYECSDCGEMHHKSRYCPNVGQEDEE
jgi:ribosomal protein L32